MKKITALILALVMVLALGGCGKSEAAQAVDDQIAALGEITLESEGAIAEAEAAVDALAEEDRSQLENTAALEEARAKYDEMAHQAELDAAAAEVEDLIAAIGEVTLDSGDAIASARSAFDGCDSEVQALIENAAELDAAETAFDDLRIAEAESLIVAFGEVTMDSGEATDAAQDYYDGLPAEIAANVSNASALESAATELQSLRQAAADELLAGMRLEEDVVRNMRFYYPSNWVFLSNGSWLADQTCFIRPYLGQDDSSTWLRLIYNYTGDDWVFFENLTIATDDERYYKYFSYFDIVRDNGGGRVWEYIDTEVSDSDIDMLWDIANSEQAIIRFEGDDYSYDYTVSDSDKQGIRDALTVYEALQP